MRGERGAPTQTLKSVPVPDTFREISARYYSMLLSFLSVLVPRTFESKAGSLRQTAGGSICWACGLQFSPDSHKATRGYSISDCGLSGEGNCGMRKDNRIKAIFSRRARWDRREKRMPGGLPLNQTGYGGEAIFIALV